MSDQGYGVSYMMAGDSRIFFHVSSKKSCTRTDSQKFVNKICQALQDMRKLFLGHEEGPENSAVITKERKTEHIEQTKLALDKESSGPLQVNGVNGAMH